MAEAIAYPFQVWLNVIIALLLRDIRTQAGMFYTGYASFTYQAGSWTRPRKVVARLECSLQPDV